jgi:type VI secretion system protein VasG
MLQIDPGAVIRTLNRHCTQALEASAGVCVSRGHYEVTVEHVLSQLLSDPNADLYLILRHFGVDRGQVEAALQRHLESQRSGNSGRPVLSPLLLTWLQDAWMVASTEHRLPATRSGALLATLLAAPHSYTSGAYLDLLDAIPRDELRRELLKVAAGSVEDEETRQAASAGGDGAPAAAGTHSRGPETALGRFTLDFTAQARAGELDPVIGRESEIRQCIDILARRRKNNPIIVGEAGTGKTALVEGIAQRVVDGEVPPQLADVDILGLDLGLLQAGAGVKGEFENRLKSVIEETKASPRSIILFIDEAHTMIGAGGPAGGSDAANLLKPSLARGELRTLAATTWSEYKKYFEKDPALTRRFQLVKVDEPSEENCVAMMRGLAPHYEKDHGIRIRDDAVVAAVQLSNRYISGRQLPDKAVDLVDTCAARVAIAQGSRPPELLDLEQMMRVLKREQAALEREEAEGRPLEPGQMERVEQELQRMRERRDELEQRFQAERAAVQKVQELRRGLTGEAAEADPGAEPAAEEGEPASEPGESGTEATAETGSAAEGATVEQLVAAQRELEGLQEEGALMHLDVTSDLVASVVSDWTGIPVGKMVQDEASTLLELEDRMAERIKGQNYALKQIAETIRAAKMGLGNPRAPIGVFLLVGPSGVGKTETGRVLADLLFGGERFMVSINMSEFQEKHTVSRLIGSPPGYVGYGEGGVLTEAVRQRPYSAVMLDEVEKADPEVMNLFYQVFDKGELSDGEGRVIDFRNTVILLTSNLGAELMTEMCMRPPPPKRKQVMDAVRPLLVKHFKAALLARMSFVPYFPLSADALRQIVDLKLDELRQRVRAAHRVELEVTDAVADQVVARCSEVETGARNIDHIFSRTLLPLLSRAMLARMSEGPMPSRMQLDLSAEGEYTLGFIEEEESP